MQIIASANETVLTVLKKFNKKIHSGRMIHYCIQAVVEEGVLLFNLLTKELLLLSHEEYVNRLSLDYLKEHWFVVPNDVNEREYADLVKWIVANKQNRDNAITSYTIFTTTDCNARCFYCFELGRSRLPMTNETALRVVEYIKAHHGGKPVKISWFGGEPLYNSEVIDTICEGLRQNKIEFRSSMISNGYLFDEQTVEKAKDQWNLGRVQITLDGTEKVYNKTKAFIYKGDSPFQVVMRNMEHLLEKAIAVSIRLNMDLYNADDLLQLVDELAERFKGKRGLSVYAHHLFKDGTPMTDLHTDTEWQERDNAMLRLETKIEENGLRAMQGISNGIKVTHCMADSGRAITILPDGHIGLCEHYTEEEFIGHLDCENFERNVIEAWKQKLPAIPECAECFLYPMCIKLKKCPNEGGCYLQEREAKRRKIYQAVIDEYQKFLKQINFENEEDADDC